MEFWKRLVFWSGLPLLLLLAGPRLTRAQGALQAPRDTVRVDLENAIRRALEVSPEVGQVAAQRAFAEARSDQARASRFLTEFNLTTAHGPAPGLSNPNNTPDSLLHLDPAVKNDWNKLGLFNRVEVQLLQPLFTWGELGGNIRAAARGVEVEEAAVAGKELEVASRTGELYYSLLLADALFRLAQEAGDIVDRAKTEIRRMLDEGAPDVDDADLFQVQITEQEYLRRVVEVRQRRRTARVALARQLFLPDSAAVEPVDQVLAPIAFTLDSLDTYFMAAMDHRPELAQARAGVAARDALVDVARSDYFPKLFLGASAAFAYAPNRISPRNPYVSDDFLERSIVAGLGFRQKLNFSQTHARVEQARAQRNEVAFQLEAAQQLVLFEVEDAYRNVIIAKAAAETQDEALTLSKEWLRTEQINFDLELGDTENLVRAVRTNLEQQAAYYEAVQQYNVAVMRLMRATGTLVSQAESGTLVE